MQTKIMTSKHHSCLFIKELSFVLTSLFLFIYLFIYLFLQGGWHCKINAESWSACPFYFQDTGKIITRYSIDYGVVKDAINYPLLDALTKYQTNLSNFVWHTLFCSCGQSYPVNKRITMMQILMATFLVNLIFGFSGLHQPLHLQLRTNKAFS